MLATICNPELSYAYAEADVNGPSEKTLIFSNTVTPPLKELRERLKMTRNAFGNLIGKSPVSIEKYESAMPGDWLEILIRISEENGYYDLVRTFQDMAGIKHPASTISLEDIAPEKRRFLEACLSLYDSPQPTHKSLVQLIQNVAANQQD